MDVVVAQTLYPIGCVILSVQKYLADFEVAVAEQGTDLRISIVPKDKAAAAPSQSDYLNHLQHSAFRYQHERDTAELRRLLLERAFAQYR